MIVTILTFLLVLGLLVFVHELGHFLAAKKAGAKVEEFGIGFPPRLFGIKKGETMYSINWVPLGGFVKILGEDGENKDDPQSFASQKFIWKVIILIAGVTMNFLLAIVLLAVGFMYGLPQPVDADLGDSAKIRDVKVTVYPAGSETPAAAAGINQGDQIKKVNAVEISEVQQLVDEINANKGKETTFLIGRGSEDLEVTATPRENPPEGEGSLGIVPVKTGIVSYPFFESIWKGVIAAFGLTYAIIVGFADLIGRLFSGSGAGADLAGPVGIAAMTGQAAKLGFAYVLQLTVLLSINLAILNILPFPALDGGRLLLVIVEKIRKKPLNQKLEHMIHAGGFIFLILVMLVVTFRDVWKFRDSFINLWNSFTGLF